MNRETVRLRELLSSPPKRRITKAEQVVVANRALIRQAIRRGHSLGEIARAVNIPKRTLQKHLGKAGLFFRRPRKSKGTVIRPYKLRQKSAKAAASTSV